MGNVQHIQKLREGIGAWNRWRKGNPNDLPDFQGVDFSSSQFRDSPLWTGDRINLDGANLSGANLSDTNLEGANLHGVNLEGAELTRAILTNAQLPKANLRNMRFTGKNLQNVNLREADLSGGDYFGIDFNRANLINANLKHANLSHANFSNAILTGADLSQANLRNIKGLKLDSTLIEGAVFSPWATDEWSVLRRTYTGPNLIINLIFVGLFFAPLLIEITGLSLVARIEHFEIPNLSSTKELPSLSAYSAGPPEDAQGTLKHRVLPAWWILLGLESPFPLNIVMPLLTCVLLLYQALRAFMTAYVSMMRDSEERSGLSPEAQFFPERGDAPVPGVTAARIWLQEKKVVTKNFIERQLIYPELFRIHKFLNYLWWISLGSLLTRVGEFLFFTKVILPL